MLHGRNLIRCDICPGEQPVDRRYSGSCRRSTRTRRASQDAFQGKFTPVATVTIPKMTLARLALAAALAATLALGHSAAQTPRTFSVTQPWLRPAAQGASSEAYMELVSSAGATLVAAQSPRAASVVVRTKARGATAIVLPAHERVVLEAGADRLVLMRVERALKLGEKVPLTLTIAYADGTREAIEVNAEVRLRSAADDERRQHHH
jgi:copper(I)-binding protein